MTKKSFLRYFVLAAIGCFITITLFILYNFSKTETLINNYRSQVINISQTSSKQQIFNHINLETLPAPVQRYFRFVFQNLDQTIPSSVSFEAEGQFRRPLMTNFENTTASQILATSEPAFIFDATTQMPLGMWAQAFDFYAQGEMIMQAKLLSSFLVVNEKSTPALNRTSLQRWLLESSINPAALLPGGPVHWETINDQQARVVVTAHDQQASLIATFRPDGSLETLHAEEDGDLSTPYHGSGEYVLREHYQLHNGMMIPMEFTIARAAQGQIYPFWIGHITHITFGN